MAEAVRTEAVGRRVHPAIVGRLRAQVMAEYVRDHPRSRDLHARAQGALPGGDTRTVTFFGPFPVYIERGEGCRLHDVDGHALLDLLGNYTSMIWGHGHPVIVNAIRSQVARGSGYGAPTELQITLAEMLRERLPSMERIRFVNSGTEADMHAVRAARAYTGRDKIVKMEGGYHGSSDGMEVSVHPDPLQAGPPASPRSMPEGSGISAPVVNDTIVVPFNNRAAVEAVLRARHREIAAVIVEPVMGAAGVIPPRDGFLTSLRALTRDLGIVLIFDEVITLRLGYHGAQGLYGVRPDLTTLGKIIGGGLPVGAFGGREEIMRLYDPGRPDALVQSGTFNANPVTMAAGIAGLGLLSAGEIDRLNRLGDRLRGGMQALFDVSPIPARVTGVGSLLNLHFTDAEIADYRHAAAVDRDLTAAFHLALLQQGVFTASRGMMALSLPMTDAESGETLEACAAVRDRLVALL